MKHYKKRTRRKGLSTVISSILLTATIVAVGGAVWNYAQGATSIISQSYIDDTIELVNDVTERFMIEYISNNTDFTTLYIWIYNYGNANVTADVYVTADDTVYTSDLDNPLYIESGEYVCANITVSVPTSESLTVKVHSRRQNNAYATYLVP